MSSLPPPPPFGGGPPPPPPGGAPPPAPSGWQIPPPGAPGPEGSPGPAGYPPFPASYATWPTTPLPPDDPLVARDGFGSWANKLTGAVRRSWRRLVPLYVVAAIPQAIAAGVLADRLGRHPLNEIIRTETGLDGQPTIRVDWDLLRPVANTIAVSALIGALIGVLVRAASVWIVTHDAAGRPTTIGEAVRFAFSRFWRLVGWQWVFSLLTIVGLMACIVPGLYMLSIGAFVVGVVCFEGRGVWDRATTLVRGSVMAVLGRVLLVVLVVAVAGQVGAAIGSALGVVVGDGVGGAIGALLAAPAGIIGGVAAVVTYAEAKARVDGTDTPNLLYDLHRGR